MILFRPVVKREMELIEEANFSKFPPRLAGQPIFYPVLTQKYAEEIASQWNAKDEFSGSRGYVTSFGIDDVYISKFEVHQAGFSYHLKYWIPAEELEEFNSHILGKIKVLKEY